MDRVVKTCDYTITRGRSSRRCGAEIESGISTPFRVGGRDYTVDLCTEHEGALAEAVQPFIDIARRVGSSLPRNARGRAVMRAKGGVTFTTKDVRNWLESQDRAISPTGRVPNALIDEYKAAHGLA